MLSNFKTKKYCNCSISSNKEILKSSIIYSFCEKCGSVLLKDINNYKNIYYTIKPKQKQNPVELSPIEIINKMKAKTDMDFPFLNNEYNMNDDEKNNQEEFMKSIDLYLSHRKMIIMTMQKMMKMLDFTDLSFYQCLFYIDTILSHTITEETTIKEILYYTVGFFLCSSKLKETDIYEPSFDSFSTIKKRIYLSVEKIRVYEIKCLKMIGHNPFAYSAYDWICELTQIGYVFDCEIDKSKSIVLINGHRHSFVNVINKYSMKVLLFITTKDIFVKFSPIYIAFSLIQISREKYLDQNLINNELYHNLINLYDVNFSDYEKCYNEIKIEIKEDIIENEKESKEKEKDNQNNASKSSDFVPKIKNKVVHIKKTNDEYEFINNSNKNKIHIQKETKNANSNENNSITEKDDNKQIDKNIFKKESDIDTHKNNEIINEKINEKNSLKNNEEKNNNDSDEFINNNNDSINFIINENIDNNNEDFGKNLDVKKINENQNGDNPEENKININSNNNEQNNNNNVIECNDNNKDDENNVKDDINCDKYNHINNKLNGNEHNNLNLYITKENKIKNNKQNNDNDNYKSLENQFFYKTTHKKNILIKNNYRKNKDFIFNKFLKQSQNSIINKYNNDIISKKNFNKKNLYINYNNNELFNSIDVMHLKKNIKNPFLTNSDINKNNSNDNSPTSLVKQNNIKNLISPKKGNQKLFIKTIYSSTQLKSIKLKDNKKINITGILTKKRKKKKEFDFNSEKIKNWRNKEELELMKQYLSFEKKISQKKLASKIKNKSKNNLPKINNCNNLIKIYDNNIKKNKNKSKLNRLLILGKNKNSNDLFIEKEKNLSIINKRNKSSNNLNLKKSKNNININTPSYNNNCFYSIDNSHTKAKKIIKISKIN